MWELIDIQKSEPLYSGFTILLKGANHQYISRIPTGKEKPKYKYVYRTQKQGIVHSDSLKEGSSFRHGDAGDAGHYHVESKNKDGTWNIKHDVTKRTSKVTFDQLKDMIHSGKHKRGEDVQERGQRYLRDYRAALEHGTKRQQEARLGELEAHIEAFGKDSKKLKKQMEESKPKPPRPPRSEETPPKKEGVAKTPGMPKVNTSEKKIKEMAEFHATLVHKKEFIPRAVATSVLGEATTDYIHSDAVKAKGSEFEALIMEKMGKWKGKKEKGGAAAFARKVGFNVYQGSQGFTRTDQAFFSEDSKGKRVLSSRLEDLQGYSAMLRQSDATSKVPVSRKNLNAVADWIDNHVKEQIAVGEYLLSHKDKIEKTAKKVVGELDLSRHKFAWDEDEKPKKPKAPKEPEGPPTPKMKVKSNVTAPPFTEFKKEHHTDDYPYGSQRTEAKWVVESNKKGERIGMTTKNPKTGAWNKTSYTVYGHKARIAIGDDDRVYYAVSGSASGSQISIMNTRKKGQGMGSAFGPSYGDADPRWAEISEGMGYGEKPAKKKAAPSSEGRAKKRAKMAEAKKRDEGEKRKPGLGASKEQSPQDEVDDIQNAIENLKDEIGSLHRTKDEDEISDLREEIKEHKADLKEAKKKTEKQEELSPRRKEVQERSKYQKENEAMLSRVRDALKEENIPSSTRKRLMQSRSALIGAGMHWEEVKNVHVKGQELKGSYLWDSAKRSHNSARADFESMLRIMPQMKVEPAAPKKEGKFSGFSRKRERAAVSQDSANSSAIAKIAGVPSMKAVDYSKLLKPEIHGLIDGHAAHVSHTSDGQRHVYFPTKAKSKEEAEKIGKKIRRNLTGKRSLTASDPYFHGNPIHVGYDGGYVTNQPKVKKSMPSPPSPRGFVIAIESTRGVLADRPFCLSGLQKARKLHGRCNIRGFNVSIENDKGTTRSGTGPDGVAWRTLMRSPYGYIRMSQGVDGDHFDVFLGPEAQLERRGDKGNWDTVYVMHIKDGNGKYDEDKGGLGYKSQDEFVADIRRHYDPPDKFVGPVSQFTIETFRKKIESTRKEPARFGRGKLHKAHPAGHISNRKDGRFQKQGDGSWKKVKEPSTIESTPEEEPATPAPQPEPEKEVSEKPVSVESEIEELEHKLEEAESADSQEPKHRMPGGEDWYKEFGWKKNPGWDGAWHDTETDDPARYEKEGVLKASKHMLRLRDMRLKGEIPRPVLETMALFAITSIQTAATTQERVYPQITEWLKQSKEERSNDDLLKIMNPLGLQSGRMKAFGKMSDALGIIEEGMRKHPTNGPDFREHVLGEMKKSGLKGLGYAKISFIAELSGYTDVACIDARVIQHMTGTDTKTRGKIASKLASKGKLYLEFEKALKRSVSYRESDPAELRLGMAQWRMWDMQGGSDTDHAVLWESIAKLTDNDAFLKALKSGDTASLLNAALGYTYDVFGGSAPIMDILPMLVGKQKDTPTTKGYTVLVEGEKSFAGLSHTSQEYLGHESARRNNKKIHDVKESTSTKTPLQGVNRP